MRESGALFQTPSRRASRRGFSFAELVLVLAIIGITSAIVLPRYSAALGNYRVDAAARRLASDIAWAQSLAKSSSSTQTIAFSLDANAYQLPGVPDPDHPGSAYTVQLTSDPYQATIVSVALSGAAVNGASLTLSFNGYGIPSAGGTIVLQSGAAQKTLTLDPDTAVVTITP